MTDLQYEHDCLLMMMGRYVTREELDARRDIVLAHGFADDWEMDIVIKLYWGHPLTTRIAGAPLFWGLRIGRWLFGRIGRST